MERVLRSKEMAEIRLLPVRHHSPACAFHVRDVIEKWHPDAVLIEGPDNANSLIPIMTDKETHAPFAIYYAYHDKTGIISEDKQHYKCYYPFLEYSPELEALRTAGENGISSAFIDLSYGEILAASAQGRGLLKDDAKNSYNDDYLLTRNEYLKQLCEKTGLRSFDEFWEKFFEINGLYEDSETWFSHLLTYCALARENTPDEELAQEGCLAREQHMASGIIQWADKHKCGDGKEQRILVVTGGFHTPALAKLLSEENNAKAGAKAKRTKKSDIDKNQSVYMMPYSMEAADALNGYASGMPFAGFYLKIWNGIKNQAAISKPYEAAVLDMLVAVGKEVRKSEDCLSTYDEICALQMARGLSELRNKREAGAYELFDAVLASYVKGEYNIAADMPVRTLRRLMTGSGSGKLCDGADVPPIITDFNMQCKRFGLKCDTALENELTLSIFSGKKHRQISMFLHRMTFLDTEFARRVKGPNLQLKKDKNLLREVWKYKWSINVHSALIDVSVHGGTVEEASASLVGERLKKANGAGDAAYLLTQVFEMGLSQQLDAVYDRVHELILQDTDFYSITDALRSLVMLDELGGLYETGLEFGALLHTAVRKLISLLPSMACIQDDTLTECMDALKLLYQITGRKASDMGQEREDYFDALDKMCRVQNINAGLNGCIYGILYGSGRADSGTVENICRGYLTGTKEQLMQTAVFFRGLFCTAKDLVFIGDSIVGLLDEFFGAVGSGEFMELLPQLRLAFTYFTPAEIDKIAGSAARLHGKEKKDITELNEVLPEWYEYGRQLDEYAKAQMLG